MMYDYDPWSPVIPATHEKASRKASKGGIYIGGAALWFMFSFFFF
jgi:hypothetical protein